MKQGRSSIVNIHDDDVDDAGAGGADDDDDDDDDDNDDEVEAGQVQHGEYG